MNTDTVLNLARKTPILILATVLALGGAVAATAESMVPTAESAVFRLNYHGQLVQGATLAEGVFELEFFLYDDPRSEAGTLLASQTLTDIEVVAGAFSAELAFENLPQDTSLWLEVRGRSLDRGGALVPLPRTPVRSRPAVTPTGSDRDFPLPKNYEADLPVPLKDAPNYVSDWEVEHRNFDHLACFAHNLGVIPSDLQIYFSPNLIDAYPLTWSTHIQYSGNPYTISVNSFLICMSIHDGVYLHGVWDSTSWTYYDTGYFRVYAWR